MREEDQHPELLDEYLRGRFGDKRISRMNEWERSIARQEGIHRRNGWMGLTRGCGHLSSRYRGVRTWKLACGAELIIAADRGGVDRTILLEQGQALLITHEQALDLLRQFT